MKHADVIKWENVSIRTTISAPNPFEELWEKYSTAKKLRKIIRRRQQTGTLVTIRELAKMSRIKQAEILEHCEDIHGININIGLVSGGGVFEFERIGDYTVEDLGYDAFSNT